MTRQSLIQGSGLQAIADYLSKSSKIAVMTNVDDVILSPGEVDYLRSQFGPRATIFPHGGHCGNIEERSFLATLTAYFTQP